MNNLEVRILQLMHPDTFEEKTKEPHQLHLNQASLRFGTKIWIDLINDVIEDSGYSMYYANAISHQKERIEAMMQEAAVIAASKELKIIERTSKPCSAKGFAICAGKIYQYKITSKCGRLKCLRLQEEQPGIKKNRVLWKNGLWLRHPASSSMRQALEELQKFYFPVPPLSV